MNLLLFATFTSLLFISSVYAAPPAPSVANVDLAVRLSNWEPSKGVCGTGSSPDTRKEIKAAFERLPNRRQDGVSPTAQVVLDVVFNIIYANQTYAGGYVPDSQIVDQVAVMNKAYAPAGISFNHIQTQRFQNAQWFHYFTVDKTTTTADLAQIDEFFMELNVGDARTLNINTLGLTVNKDGLLGVAPVPLIFPPDVALGLDAVFIKWNSLPGSPTGRNGSVAVHETGHWLGLYHTFEGGCEGDGDSVADTPAHVQPDVVAEDCVQGQDTCPNVPGLDPIHNWMAYTSEACRNQFTPGQIYRMHQTLQAYRAPSPVTTTAPAKRK